MTEYRPYVTWALIAANIAVFFAELFFGGSENANTALRFGALYVPYVTGRGEWFRLFTAMFVHFGIQHIASNMISLAALGNYVERYLGRVRFLILYLASGLGGNLLVLFMESQSTARQNALNAGASGAICGLMGVLVIIAVQRSVLQRRLRDKLASAGFSGNAAGSFSGISGQMLQELMMKMSDNERAEIRRLASKIGRLPALPLRRVMIAVFLMLYPGLIDRSVSMEGHLGGLITGLALAALFAAAEGVRNSSFK